MILIWLIDRANELNMIMIKGVYLEYKWIWTANL